MAGADVNCTFVFALSFLSARTARVLRCQHETCESISILPAYPLAHINGRTFEGISDYLLGYLF